jgi:predicted dithiol-disulfide oxidoreductase (DUF899 family)
MRGVYAITVLFERRPRRVERFRRPAQVAQDERDLGLSDDTSRASHSFFRTEGAPGTSQKRLRPREIAELRHRNAAKRQGSGVVTQPDPLQHAKHVARGKRAGRSGDQRIHWNPVTLVTPAGPRLSANYVTTEKGQHAMNMPEIASPQEWEAARTQLLAKEKALTRARDALAAERRRMPWLAVEKTYAFDGPEGTASLLDLFDGRRQLIVYRAFFEPGVHGWPDHACIGCSLGADQVGRLAHLNARDTTLVYVSRAPQSDIARLKARMGWTIPWHTITDSFDADFGVDEWHGHNAFIREGERIFRTYFINNRADEAMGTVWSYLDLTALGRQETWEDSPEGYPQSRPYKWWNWSDSYVPAAAPDPKWVEVSDAGEAAFRKRSAEGSTPAQGGAASPPAQRRSS